WKSAPPETPTSRPAASPPPSRRSAPYPPTPENESLPADPQALPRETPKILPQSAAPVPAQSTAPSCTRHDPCPYAAPVRHTPQCPPSPATVMPTTPITPSIPTTCPFHRSGSPRTRMLRGFNSARKRQHIVLRPPRSLPHRLAGCPILVI